ncbi:four helix bundle protein [Candidatus Gottesmanbacteria bacterium]|nr:four helix bundle protein [Candidatus Gottesmanbacteria bacterium]
MAKEKYKIHDRIYSFVLRVLNAVKEIPRTPENVVLIKQVVRSSASIGANASEADGAESKKEFIHRFTIAKKEAKETLYWVMLISDHNELLKKRFLQLLDENKQIIAIISKIIINAKSK